MTDDAKCYGNYKTGSQECRDCEYRESCQLYTKTQGRMNQPLGGQDYDEISEYAANVADYSSVPGQTEEDESQKEQRDFAGFLNFLLHLDDYTLGVLAEIIAPSQGAMRRLTVAEIARIRGISRQGMHRKTLDIARKSPELASLLKLAVMKIRKSRHDFRHIRQAKPQNVRQMEFKF